MATKISLDQTVGSIQFMHCMSAQRISRSSGSKSRTSTVNIVSHHLSKNPLSAFMHSTEARVIFLCGLTGKETKKVLFSEQ